MKRSDLLRTLMLALTSGGVLFGQADVRPVHKPSNPFRTVGAWGTLPQDRAWGPVSAVHVDRDGRSIWVAERLRAADCGSSTLAPILEFDANGILVTSFGPGPVPGPPTDSNIEFQRQLPG